VEPVAIRQQLMLMEVETIAGTLGFMDMVVADERVVVMDSLAMLM
jgi:hypothetical protein